MKKLSLLFALLFSLFVKAQDYPGKMPQLLLNKEVTMVVNDMIKKYGYNNFYKDNSLSKKYACCQKYNSKYDKLVNRTFTVKEVKPGKSGYSILTLNDDSETIYFKYDPAYEFKFPFEVIGGLDLPDDFYCKKISKKPTSNDPSKYFYITNRDEGILYFKMESNGVTSYIINLSIPSTKLSDTAETSIELENGEVIKASIPEVKKEESEYGGYIYNGRITLGNNDIELLKQYKIVGLSINGIKSKIKQGETHKRVFNCLTTVGNEPQVSSAVGSNSDCNYNFIKGASEVRKGWSHTFSETIDGVTFIKMTEKATGAEEYQAVLEVISPDEKLNKQSGILILEGMTLIEQQDATVRCRAADGGSGYVLSAFIKLSKEQVEMLKVKNVIGKMVYIADERVTNGDKLKNMFICLTEQR